MARIATELVRHLLEYDPETGVFRWIRNRAGTAHMARAGCVDTDPAGCRRRRIRINGQMYKASDLAWLYMTGEWPILTVDHENRIGDDDRWDNLRLATRSQQMMNRRSWGSVKSRGVNFTRGKYYARIQVDGKSKFLGTFDTEEQAKLAYDAASAQLHGAFGGVH